MRQACSITDNRAQPPHAPTFLCVHRKSTQRAAHALSHAKGEAELHLMGLQADDGGIRLDGDKDLWLVDNV